MLGHKGCVCCGGQGEAASVFGESRMISGAVNLLSGERVGWKYMEGLQLGERFDSVGSKGPERLDGGYKTNWLSESESALMGLEQRQQVTIISFWQTPQDRVYHLVAVNFVKLTFLVLKRSRRSFSKLSP